MQYPAPDGTMIQSSNSGPVIYNCASPSNWSDGTYVSYETTSNSNNELVQIKITRVVNDGQVQITVTEQTQQEIQDYFQNINN